jgi:class 3 adenylate cyclase
MRIGIHSGNILAGVIGTHRLRYDMWGEDCMIANKMESACVTGGVTGVTGDVLVSEDTNRCVAAAVAVAVVAGRWRWLCVVAGGWSGGMRWWSGRR